MGQFDPEKILKGVLKLTIFSIFIVLTMSTPLPCAMAHNVILTAYVEGDMVFVEGGFSDGSFCRNSKIEVFDRSGNKLLEGRTDENGEFSFKPPQKTDLKVVLNAGMGHRAEYRLPVEELPDTAGTQKSGSEPMAGQTVETGKANASDAAVKMDPAEIESIVDRVIQKRLRPLTQLVAKSQRNTGVSPTKVFGGIGYIFGLLGIAMYCRSRKGGKV